MMSEEVLRFVHRKKNFKKSVFSFNWEPVFIYHLVRRVGKIFGDPTVFGGERRGISRL